MIGLVFVAVMLALIWGVVVALELPLMIAGVPTATALVAVTIVVVVRALQARKAAAALEGAIKSQAAQQEEAVRPDMRPEVQAMRAEFNKALASLKLAKGGKGGTSALAVLPWYMIIGPPGGGKSTALRNSGLQFPYVSKRGGGVKGVGGTRNCEWWFTNEAIILDTAGRYAVEEDDRDEWLSFLDTVVKSRPRKPINGLIVAISISELMEGEEDAAERGTLLRERVDEVLTKLRMNVPVYVLFTKCDLISGFVDMFNDLGRAERGQVWGFTEPLQGRTQSSSDIFNERFDELRSTLHARALLRLQKNRRLEARERIWQFPREFEALQANFSEFIGALFAENPMTDTPPMRGVYFTSGTQVGKPFDRMMRSMAEAFGVSGGAEEGDEEGETEARSYFLKDVFSNIIFPDQNLAVASTAENQRQKRLRLYTALGALGLALLFSALPALSFKKNLALVRETRDAVNKSKAVLSAGDKADATKKLTRLHNQVEKLRQFDDDGAPIMLRLGMYVGDTLYEKATVLYLDTVKKLYVSQVLDADADELRELIGKPELTQATPEVAAAIDKLKLNLLLTAPKAEDEPEFNEAVVEWAGREFIERWIGAGELPDEASQNEAYGHVELYLQLLAQNKNALIVRDQALVKATRRALDKVPVAQLTLAKVMANPVFEDQGYSLATLIGTTSRYIRGSGKVHGAFTKKSWESSVKKLLDDAKDDSDSWVLAKTKSASASELKAEYFKLYQKEWKQFIDSIQIEQPRGNEEAMAMLEELTRSRPFNRLFEVLAVNTKITVDNEVTQGVKNVVKKGLGALKAKLGPMGDKVANAGANAMNDAATLGAKDLEKAFAGLVKYGYAPPGPEGAPPAATPLVLYMEDLEKLRDALRTALESPQEKNALKSLLATVRVKVRGQIDDQEAGWRPTIERFVWPPISWLTKTTAEAGARDTGDKWCSEVYSPFASRLAGRYPFRAEGRDVSLDDTVEFYKAGGLVDTFYDTVLKKEIQRSGDRFEFIKSMGDVPPYTEAVLAFLKRAKEIQSALFPPQSPEPKADFFVHIRGAKNVAVTTFTIDGDTIEYRNGADEWKQLKWPGSKKGSGASLRVKSKSGLVDVVEFPGEWALFRLLEAGAMTRFDDRLFAVTWPAPTLESQVTIDFKANRTDNPFLGPRDKALFEVFRGASVPAPTTLGTNTPPCRR